MHFQINFNCNKIFISVWILSLFIVHVSMFSSQMPGCLSATGILRLYVSVLDCSFHSICLSVFLCSSMLHPSINLFSAAFTSMWTLSLNLYLFYEIFAWISSTGSIPVKTCPSICVFNFLNSSECLYYSLCSRRSYVKVSGRTGVVNATLYEPQI
jgi:hypothetical protein